ncbi:MAG: sigma-70 family RNA polymerase sigma factor [Clostridia bacterium]|nr:sigma-70 family RNA polymerase sigma factor [Clostridia bacterium]
MLDNQETARLLKLAKSGDDKAKNRLLIENSPLIKSVIKFYKNKGVEYQDLFELGAIGFVKAINNFDESFNVKFTTYAVPMVAGEVKRFLRDDGTIKVSRSIKSLQVQINKYITQYKNENLGQTPTIEELAKKFNIEPNEVIFALDSRKAIISLDDKQDENSERSRTILESIAEEDKIDNLIDNIMLKSIIKELPIKEKHLLYLRYFQDKTQSEIAKVLNVSQVQVSRLENKLIEKLRTKIM